MKDLKKTFSDKNVLITGHTGFKGSWLSMWLNHIGANVIGLSDEVPTKPSNYEVNFISNSIKDYRVDIRNYSGVFNAIEESSPDFVFHLAAQSLVRESYENPLKTMEVNAIGSANILESLVNLKKNVVAVMITSDKAYDNVEWVWGYKETDRLGGKECSHSDGHCVADCDIPDRYMHEYNINCVYNVYTNQGEPNVRKDYQHYRNRRCGCGATQRAAQRFTRTC
mgnify:CR=1 FL=1